MNTETRPIQPKQNSQMMRYAWLREHGIDLTVLGLKGQELDDHIDLKIHEEKLAEDERIFRRHAPTPPDCDHEWSDDVGGDNGFNGSCTKCGMSFARYAFTEAP